MRTALVLFGVIIVALAFTAGLAIGATTTETFTYWHVQTNDNSPDTGAYTWVGAEDGELGDSPTPDRSVVLLTVYYRVDDTGVCVPSVEAAFEGLVEDFATANVQAGSGETYELELKPEMGDVLTSGVVQAADLRSVLDDIRAGTGARIGIERRGEPMATYVVSLLGATAATTAALAHCERLATTSE